MTKDKKFAVLRIGFGLIWAVDAFFKWSPAIRDNIIGVLTQTAKGQPAWEASWIQLWVHVASINPPLFGILVALVETALAAALIFGIFPRIALWCGFLFILFVWSVPQGFGGPYAAGATDIDSGLIYALVFIALIIGHGWREYALGTSLAKRFVRA